MNAGFSNLAALKAQLLAPSLRLGTSHDAALLAIGRGVAGQFGGYCNRVFPRAEGVKEILAADAIQFCLERYPVEAVTTVELKLTETEGWVAQTNFIRNIDNRAGIVFAVANADVGPYYAQVRFTYTGGYWWDTSDEGETPQSLPTGATPVPDELVLAWHLQCRAAWAAVDKLGVNVTTNDAAAAQTLSTLALLPEVKEILGDFVRYQMT